MSKNIFSTLPGLLRRQWPCYSCSARFTGCSLNKKCNSNLKRKYRMHIMLIHIECTSCVSLYNLLALGMSTVNLKQNYKMSLQRKYIHSDATSSKIYREYHEPGCVIILKSCRKRRYGDHICNTYSDRICMQCLSLYVKLFNLKKNVQGA